MSDNEWRWWWGYGTEPEQYEADFPTREAAIAALPQGQPGAEFTVCEARRATLSDYLFDPEAVVDDWCNLNSEYADPDGELSMDPSPSQLSELRIALNTAFADWRAQYRLGRAWTLEVSKSEVVIPCPEVAP